MTVIAAAINPDGSAYMGADSASLQDQNCVRFDARLKIFYLGEFLLGVTGTHRASEIIEHLFTPPTMIDFTTEYLVREFIPALQLVMAENGRERTTKEGLVKMDGALIGAVRGQLFDLDSSYGVLRPLHPFHAVGCAAQEALAAMFTAKAISADLPAQDVVMHGLRASAEFDVNIRPPFHVLKIE